MSEMEAVKKKLARQLDANILLEDELHRARLAILQVFCWPIFGEKHTHLDAYRHHSIHPTRTSHGHNTHSLFFAHLHSLTHTSLFSNYFSWKRRETFF